MIKLKTNATNVHHRTPRHMCVTRRYDMRVREKQQKKKKCNESHAQQMIFIRRKKKLLKKKEKEIFFYVLWHNEKRSKRNCIKTLGSAVYQVSC